MKNPSPSLCNHFIKEKGNWMKMDIASGFYQSSPQSQILFTVFYFWMGSSEAPHDFDRFASGTFFEHLAFAFHLIRKQFLHIKIFNFRLLAQKYIQFSPLLWCHMVVFVRYLCLCLCGVIWWVVRVGYMNMIKCRCLMLLPMNSKGHIYKQQ